MRRNLLIFILSIILIICGIILYKYVIFKSEINEVTTSDITVERALTSDEGTETVTFDTTDQHVYYSIYVENDSNADYIVATPEGSYIVEKKSTRLIWNTVQDSSSNKVVDISSEDGSKLSGKVTVLVADSQEEVGTK